MFLHKRNPKILCLLYIIFTLNSETVVKGQNFQINNDDIVFAPDSDFMLPKYNLRKSDIKCKEYGKPFTETVRIAPLTTKAELKEFSVSTCETKKIPLIINGTPAVLNEFPHMAALGFTNDDGSINWNCGGTLISEQYVLTAGHCRKYGPPVRVRLGEIELNSENDGPEVQELSVAQMILHPDYHPPIVYNDLALVRLVKPVKLSKKITPACLYTQSDISELNGVATGWGTTEYGGLKSDRLLKVSLPIIANDKCKKIYSQINRKMPDGIRLTQLCAGEKDGGKDTCQGDSGGPLQIINKENSCQYKIIGITSFGKLCAAAGSAGVYTRISTYLDWIESIVWP